MKRLYMAFLPEGAGGSEGWVLNTVHYDCCHYLCMQALNPVG